jgi:uncharacterized protein DUF5916
VQTLRRAWGTVLVRCVCFALTALPLAAEPPSFVLPRLHSPITVDGNLEEAAWREALVIDRFYEIVPGDNVEPPVKTVGLLGYDDQFLYVGVRCQDPDPSQIRAPFVERDHVTDQDLVQVDIDARNEGRWSMIFRVNPRGVQLDGIFDEVTGQDDYSPDFYYDSAVRLTAEGWTVEMKIPLSTLRYRVGADLQTWRITFFRLYPRNFRYQIVSAPIPRDSSCWLCHSVRLTGITGLPKSSNLTVAPFVTGRASEDPGARPRSEQQFDLGGDVKWQPRPDLALDLAVNPDFSQVEADAPQISVNRRFALFFPEKRPFFLEGSDLLSSPIPIVYTRTITDPDWGARLTGRADRSAYTVLVARDHGEGSQILPGPVSSDLVPQTAATVVLARYRQTFGTSSVGFTATGREGEDGQHNNVAGADFQWFPSEHDRTKGQLLWSSTRDRGSGEKTDHALHFDWAHTLRQVGWSLQFEDLGRDFRADSGFVPQTGVRHIAAEAGYTFYPQGIFRSLRPLLSFDQVREQEGALVSRTLFGGLAFDGRVQGSLEWHPREEGRASDGRIFQQDYWFLSTRVLPSRKVPLLSLAVRYGDEIDFAGSRLGTGSTVTLLALVSPFDELQAELSGERHQLDVTAGGKRVRAFLATVSQVKVTYAFTARSFTRLIGQWNALTENGGADDSSFSGSVLYGYRLNWQSILYVGYGDEPGQNLELLPKSRHHALFIKISYAFRT